MVPCDVLNSLLIISSTRRIPTNLIPGVAMTWWVYYSITIVVPAMTNRRHFSLLQLPDLQVSIAMKIYFDHSSHVTVYNKKRLKAVVKGNVQTIAFDSTYNWNCELGGLHKHYLRNDFGVLLKCTQGNVWSGLILGLCPANERPRYKATTSLIAWAQT